MSQKFFNGLVIEINNLPFVHSRRELYIDNDNITITVETKLLTNNHIKVEGPWPEWTISMFMTSDWLTLRELPASSSIDEISRELEDVWFASCKNEGINIFRIMKYKPQRMRIERSKQAARPKSIPKESIPDIEDRRFLDPDYIDMDRALLRGYKSLRNKLIYFYFDGQPYFEERILLVESQRKVLERMKRTLQDLKRDRIETARILTGRANVLIIYPSGISYRGRLQFSGHYAIIEPVKGDTAAWVLQKKDVENNEVLDLRVLPYTRIVHNSEGIDTLKFLLTLG